MKKPLLLGLLLCLCMPARAAELWQELRFVDIPAGSFSMGSEQGRYKDERPVHRLSIGSFLMMDHELSVGEAKRLLKQYPNLIKRALTSPTRDDPRKRVGNEDDLPVLLTYAEAEALASKLSEAGGKRVRLPTEPEWEYAARGGLDRKLYPWGNPDETFRGKKVRDLVRAVRGGDDCDPFSSVPVGPVRTMTPSNGYGLFDTAGNAWEWTSSIYQRYPYASQSGGRLQRKQDDLIVIRGGGQAPEACDVRVALRGYAQPDSMYGVRFVAEK